MIKLFHILLMMTTYFFIPVYAQQKMPLTEDAYHQWQSIENTTISDNGKWISFQLQPGQGDGKLVLFQAESNEEVIFDRGRNGTFDHTSSFLVFTVHAPTVLLDSLQRIKTKESELPPDTLCIYNLSSHEIKQIPYLKSYHLPKKWGNGIYYAVDTEKDTSLAGMLPRKMKETEEIMVRVMLPSLTRDTFWYISQVEYADDSSSILMIGHAPDTSEIQYAIQIRKNNLDTIYAGDLEVKQASISPRGHQSSLILKVKSDEDRTEQYKLLYFSSGQTSARNLEITGLPNHWIISPHQVPLFSEDRQRIFFGISPLPLYEDTTQLDKEKVDVEVWTYLDGLLYTQQKVKISEERERSYFCTYDLSQDSFLQLATLDIPEIILTKDRKGPIALGTSDIPYRHRLSWEGQYYQDLFYIDLDSGERRLISREIAGAPQLSPGGRFAYWYNRLDTSWSFYEFETEELQKIVRQQILFYDEENDHPDHPTTYGLAGWSAKDHMVYLYDRYDIWECDPQGLRSPSKVTSGRESQTVYRYIDFEEEDSIVGDELLLHGFDERSKAESYARLNLVSRHLDTLISIDGRLMRQPIKARNADAIIYTQETFEKYPDLIFSDIYFEKSKTISQANPQQDDYLWGRIELVYWQDEQGIQREGLLVKPEGFNPARKYPMIVNFYEKSSDELHRHRPPQPHRSSINYSFYASNGYLIFNPDIHYKIGYPGKSALEAVVSGTEAMIEKGWVDPGKIGLQGHSWGAYQIAHIITKTDMFACAEAGAPVVNMVSAYGGIRWQTGLSRMFQYEHTQSRLGASLWERPELYLENSPIFNIDKINTPVLILHNDHDGHVPWYQGIEFFVALRRLGKPAWFLNYNNEPHWPLKWAHRLDFNRRMFQFFNHYLKGDPIPRWMSEGIPAVEKGINYGFELENR